MKAVSTCNGSRYARVLVILALLLASGLQVEELRHWHDAGEVQAQCMLCQASADNPLPVTTATPGQAQRAVAAPDLYAAALHTVAADPALARGPPPHS